MFAAFRVEWAGRRAVQILAALAVAGCASGAPPVDPALIESPSDPNSERPAFFVMWRTGNMAGLTARPTLDRSSGLPQYPASALRDQSQGTTVLDVCVTADGKLVDVKIAKSSGTKVLDDATLDWARNAKYKPAMFNDEPFAVCGYTVEYVWQVEDSRG
jgi:protein TonB